MSFPIIGVQGASAAGKSTLCARLARESDGVVIHELAESADWRASCRWRSHRDEAGLLANRRAFLEYECRRWRRAVTTADTQPAIFDTEWIGQLLWGICDVALTHADFDAVRLTRETLAMYRERVETGDLACCDAIVLLQPEEETVRRQREADPSRRRRNFERNLRVAALQRRYWEALRPLFASRLLFVSDGARAKVPAFVPLSERARRVKAEQVIVAITGVVAAS